MRKLILIFTTMAAFGCGHPTETKNVGASSSSTPPAQSMGTINGGGGVGVRCADGKLEMLDLFEARQAGRTMAGPPTSLTEAEAFVAGRLAKHFWNLETIPDPDYTKMLGTTWVNPIFEGSPMQNPVTGKVEPVNYVTSLPLSNDFGNVSIPASCHLEQIAYYSDAKTALSIVQSAWAELDWMSKSVLVSHELLYLTDRRDGLEALIPNAPPNTSALARKFVGQLLSVAGLPTFTDKMPTIGVLRCSDSQGKAEGSTYFYAFESGGHMSFVFNTIEDRNGLYQMRTDFSAGSLTTLTDLSAPEMNETADLSNVGDDVASGFSLRLSKVAGSAAALEVLYSGVRVGGVESLHCDKL